MQDGFIRKSIKHIARFRHAADLKLTRLLKSVRSRNPYRLAGSCLQCGKCCGNPTIRIYPLLFYLKSLRQVIITWQRAVNGFDFLEETAGINA